MELMKAYIQQMKVENPEDYKKLVKGFGSESDVENYVESLTKRAMKSIIEEVRDDV